ncbi:trimeric intracellular cation channel family protein [Phenylobacterium sp.]|uniref:trimeric intracellular cation channel family protein n=1 Tax=Phenylobacterium sp. TaxID=1871053 RepID=UPI0035C7A7F6
MEGLDATFIWLDYAAVFVFGASGALAAARRKHDIVTFTFFAAVTGVGGGTLRDLLIDAPVFWVVRPQYLLAALAAAVAVWAFGAGKARLAILGWLDALGLAAYAIVGAAKALAFGVPAGPAVVMGVLTATFGGVLRDVLAEEPSVLLKREIYVSAALVGAAVFVAAQALGAPELPASLGGFLAAFTVRAGAILFGWSLPGFPGRTPTDDEG